MKNPVSSKDVIFSKHTVFSQRRQRRPALKVIRGEEADAERDEVRLIKHQFRRESEPDPIRDLFEKEEDKTGFRIIGLDGEGNDVWAPIIGAGGERHYRDDSLSQRWPLRIGFRITRTKR